MTQPIDTTPRPIKDTLGNTSVLYISTLTTEVHPDNTHTGLTIVVAAGTATTVNSFQVTDTDGTTIRTAINSQGLFARGAVFGAPASGSTPSYDVVEMGLFCHVSVSGNGFMRLASNAIIGWGGTNDNPNGSSSDVGLARTAAGVAQVQNGQSVGYGWIQDAGIARNTADVTNATTTFATLPDLTINVLAGRKYIGVVKIKCNNSTAAEGIKFDFNGGTATITSFWAAASEMVGGTTVLGTVISTSLAGVINYTTITGETLIEITISFVVNAAGTLIPRFAENSHAAGTATVELGSFIRLDDSPN